MGNTRKAIIYDIDSYMQSNKAAKKAVAIAKARAMNELYEELESTA